MNDPTSTADRLKGDLSAHTPMMQQCIPLGSGVQASGNYAETYAG